MEEAIIFPEPTENDRNFYQYPLTNRPKHAYHGNILNWIADQGNVEKMKILEIGSREVASASIWKDFIPNCKYTGFDVLAGKNVDVVGDAHRLTDYFKPGEFDFIFSFAVFEHLAMPWVVSEEITKLLKIGGHVCIETHFSFSEHELPWHFFQFNQKGLECLFNEGLGYELVDSGKDNPIIGRFGYDSADYLRGQMVGHLYCHSSIIAKKTEDVFINKNSADIWRDSYNVFLKGSMYPKNTGLSQKE